MKNLHFLICSNSISLVSDNGIIVVNGTVTPASNEAFAGSKLGKTVTVTGGDNGVIDLTGVQFAQLKNNMTFKDISLKFTNSYYLFACGYMMGGTTYSVYGVGTTTAADANISANIGGN